MLRRLPHIVAHRQGNLPGDLASFVEHQKLSADMFADERGLEIIAAQGKYAPFHHALLESWKKQRQHSALTALAVPAVPAVPLEASSEPLSQASRSQCYQCRGAFMLRVLRPVIQKMAGQKQSEWVDSCGRKVGRVIGWLATANRLCLVRSVESFLGIKPKTAKQKAAITAKKLQAIKMTKKQQESALKGSTIFELGASLTPYVWLPDGVPAAITQLSLMAQIGDALSEQTSPPPRTCQEWLSIVRSSSKAWAKKTVWCRVGGLGLGLRV